MRTPPLSGWLMSINGTGTSGPNPARRRRVGAAAPLCAVEGLSPPDSPLEGNGFELSVPRWLATAGAFFSAVSDGSSSRNSLCQFAEADDCSDDTTARSIDPNSDGASKSLPISRGTESSNPLPSSEESANSRSPTVRPATPGPLQHLRWSCGRTARPPAAETRRASTIGFLPWQPARRSKRSPLHARALARTMSAPRLPGTSGPAASKSAMGSSMPHSRLERSNTSRQSEGRDKKEHRPTPIRAGITVAAMRLFTWATVRAMRPCST
jgi:hypothetical protein